MALGITHVLSITGADVKMRNTHLKHLQIWLEDDSEADLSGSLELAFEFMLSAHTWMHSGAHGMASSASGEEQGGTRERGEGGGARRTGAVLVHCEAGISRSAATVIAYLVRYRDFTLEEAFALVKARRSIVSPNHGFVQQLLSFETRLRHDASRDPFPFVLYWLRNFVHALKDVPEEEARAAWDISNGRLDRTWHILLDAYEQKYLLPALGPLSTALSDDESDG